MANQQIITTGQPKTMLGSYGSRVELREMADRIKRTLWVTFNRETRRPNESESLMLAAGSLAHGLDPWLKELQLLFDKNGVPVLYPSPSAYEKAALKQMQDQGGGNFWPEFYPINESDDRALHLIPPHAIAWRCKLFDTATIRTYTDAVAAMSKAGAPWHEIKEILGNKPYTEGIGQYAPSNVTAKMDDMYNPVERAKKRSYHAALKKRFALPFPEVASDGDINPEFVGSYLMAPDDAARPQGGDEQAGEIIIEQAPPNAAAQQASDGAPEAPPPNPDDFSDPRVVDASMQRAGVTPPAGPAQGQRTPSTSRPPAGPARKAAPPAKPGDGNRKLFDHK